MLDVERNPIRESTSWTLVERVKDGEPEGWRRLELLYTPLVRARCRRAGLCVVESEEIVQEVFLTVWARIGGFQKQPGPSFRSWLRRIAMNKIGDYLRRVRKQAQAAGGTDAQRAFGQIADEAGEISKEDDLDDSSERRLLIRQALRLVSSEYEPRTWQALWRVVVEGQQPADVASELGMTPNAVYIAKSRILGRLRQLLVELGESSFDTGPGQARSQD
jgi:RNA polymerase sigma-70 factor (ECF subfamily)